MGDLEMLTREQLQGVLIAVSKPVFAITKDSRYAVGYNVRLSVKISTTQDLATTIQRTLHQHGIVSQVGRSKNGHKQKGILTVTANGNLYKLLELIPMTLPTVGNWMVFKQALDIVNEGRHQTQEGLDKLFEIKGLI
tara:strand:- start:456 stop:866 length:411 start_codon:yes stop_codon:yes gene_type:complete